MAAKSIAPSYDRINCSAAGCSRSVIARGLCAMHYQRLKKHGSVAKPEKKRQTIEFLQNVPETDECILWPFGRGNSGVGYGVVSFRGAQTTAHRASLIIHSGDPPTSGHHAAHDPISCASILCINPRHLRWALPTENAADKEIRGTKTRGIVASTSQLSEEDVIAISVSSDPPKECAKHYGVCEETIRRIRSGYCWGWLTGLGKRDL